MSKLLINQISDTKRVILHNGRFSCMYYLQYRKRFLFWSYWVNICDMYPHILSDSIKAKGIQYVTEWFLWWEQNKAEKNDCVAAHNHISGLKLPKL